MSIIAITSGVFCAKNAVVKDLILSTGYRHVTQEDIITRASRMSGIPETKIKRVFTSKTSVFNKFTHEKEHSIAHIKLALGRLLLKGDLIVDGPAGLVAPKKISHVLKVCLAAEMPFRVRRALEAEGLAEKEAQKRIRRGDEDLGAWTETLFHINIPWDNTLHDIVIPMHKTSSHQASALIAENVLKDVVRPTEDSRRAVHDFLLSAETEVALSKEGHNVSVSAENGTVTITINQHVLMLNRLEEELKGITAKVPGVTSVRTRIGRSFHKSDTYRKHDFKIPSKVLLVDDERELVQTLSERLILREMGSVVAYDGASALELVREDEPEVMIIDLKLPGIDGIEVLKQVKQINPHIQVIIITGHGSETDKKRCLELGAFDYMLKPVNIEKLSEALKKAQAEIRRHTDKRD